MKQKITFFAARLRFFSRAFACVRSLKFHCLPKDPCILFPIYSRSLYFSSCLFSITFFCLRDTISIMVGFPFAIPPRKVAPQRFAPSNSCNEAGRPSLFFPSRQRPNFRWKVDVRLRVCTRKKTRRFISTLSKKHVAHHSDFFLPGCCFFV